MPWAEASHLSNCSNHQFSDYKRIEDIRGECDTLCKRSVISRSRGDISLAEDWAGRYITLYNSHMTAFTDEDDVPESHGFEGIES